MGAVGYVGQAFSYLTALKYASSGLVALLLYLYPMFVVILSVVVLALALVGAGLWVTRRVSEPFAAFSGERFVEIGDEEYEWE
mgnify:CR=1 FL=1